MILIGNNLRFLPGGLVMGPTGRAAGLRPGSIAPHAWGRIGAV